MHQQNHNNQQSSVFGLALAALGVVYGDIGTSPLYAFKEAFTGAHGIDPSEAHVLATLSAFFWAVLIIVSLKYVWVVLRFDNEGEGGVLALTALAHRVASGPRWALLAVGGGIFAAALFYGDAIITPAISVLSAVEGISIATPHLERYVVPITVGILVGLFMIQKHGTGQVGRFFGPVTVLWFATLAVLGCLSIVQTPEVLRAVDPRYAIDFAIDQPHLAFVLLSAVFLSLTGGEALYADMGHFGAKPVRLAWYGLVWPALVLNYFGQGALVLRSPVAIESPFYMLAPDWLLLPLVGLATLATVIASQATITGAYSMTLQATRLGYLPRLRILHTSDTERGQIYVPSVNWLMLVAVIVLVLQFRSSGALAAAYGIAVSGTMIITTLLTAFILMMSEGRMRIGLLGALANSGAAGAHLLLNSLFIGLQIGQAFAEGGDKRYQRIGGRFFEGAVTQGAGLVVGHQAVVGIHIATGAQEFKQVFHPGAHFSGRCIAGVGHSRFDLFAHAVFVGKKIDIVLFTQAFAHFPVRIGRGKNFRRFGKQRLRMHEIFLAKLVVETLRNIARQFEVLLLVFSDRYIFCPVEYNISRL